jgi:O-antigen/teichoic acid export membrane protein
MEGHREHKAIARNALSSYAARGVLGIVALALTPYLFRALGPSGFGTWSVIFGLTAIALVLQIGISQGLTKMVAELPGHQRGSDLHDTMGAGLSLMAGAGAVMLAVAVVVAVAFPRLAAEGEEGAFQAGLLLVGVALFVRMPCMACAAALVGHQRYDLANIGNVATTLVFAAGAVVAIESGAGIVGVAGAQALALTVGGIVYALTLRHLCPDLSLRPRLDQGDTRRRMMRFSSFTLLADSMVLVGQRLDVVVIAALAGAAAAGPYAAVVKLQSALQSLTRPFIDLLMPMVADLTGRGQQAEVLRRLTVTTRLALQISIPVAAAMAIFASDIVIVWLGDDAPPTTQNIVVLLMVANVIGLVAIPATEALIGLGRVRIIGALAVVEGLLNLGLSLLLVSIYGAVGAAIGTLVAVTVLGPLRLPLAVRAAGGSTRALLRGSVAIPLLSSGPAIVTMISAHQLLSAGWGRLALGSLVGFAVAVAIGALQLGPKRIRGLLRVAQAKTMTG